MRYLVVATGHATDPDPEVSAVAAIEADSVEHAGEWLEAVRQRVTGVTSHLRSDDRGGWWFATVRGTVGVIALD